MPVDSMIRRSSIERFIASAFEFYLDSIRDKEKVKDVRPREREQIQ